MPKNKFEDVIFTAVMAIVMVYGMIVYNVEYRWNCKWFYIPCRCS